MGAGAGGLWATRHLHMFCRRFVSQNANSINKFCWARGEIKQWYAGGGALMELYFVFIRSFFCVRKFSILYCDYILNIV